MTDNFDACLKLVLQSEGGYVNDPKDPGGITNLGVTKRVWEEWVGHDVTEGDMERLLPVDVAPLYRNKYWSRIKGDDLPTGLDYCCFDFAVNGGTGRAAKILQAVLGVAEDGIIGDATLAKLGSDVKSMIEQFCAKRQEYYESLPTFDHFGRGWTARVQRVQADATSMIG
jgi:lysozyme family protein